MSESSKGGGGGGAAAVTTEQLLIGIGQLVKQLADQSKKTCDYLDTVDKLISGALTEKLDKLAAILAAPLRIEQPESAGSQAPALSLEPAIQKMDAIEQRLAALAETLGTALQPREAQDSPSGQAAVQKLGAIEEKLGALQDSLSAATRPAETVESPALAQGVLKLGAIEDRLAAMQNALSDAMKPSEPVDPPSLALGVQKLGSIEERLAGMQEALSSAMKPSEPVDPPSLALGVQKLGAIEERLSALAAALEPGTGEVESKEVELLRTGIEKLGDIDQRLTTVQEAMVATAWKPQEIVEPLSLQTGVQMLGSIDQKLSAISTAMEAASGSTSGLETSLTRTGESVSSALAQASAQIREDMKIQLEKLASIEQALPTAGEGGHAKTIEAMTALKADLSALSAAASTIVSRDPAASLLEPISSVKTELAASAASAATVMEASLKKAAEDLTGGLTQSRQETLAVLSVLDTRISGLAGSLAEMGTLVGQSSQPAVQAAAALGDLKIQVASVGEALTTAMESAGRDSTSALSLKLDVLSQAVAALAPAVDRMQSSMETRLSGFEEKAGGALEGVGTALDSHGRALDAHGKALDAHGKALETMQSTLVQSAESQNGTLGTMQQLLQVHRDAVLREQVEDLNNEAIHFFNDGRPNEAMASLEKAIALEPDRAELWTNLGHVRSSSDDIEGAEQCFRKALTLQAGLEPALSGLGILLVKAGRAQETLEFLRRFIEDATPSARVAIAYARALTAQGRHAEAAALLQKAASATPGNPDIEAELARYTEKS
jgi:tetratricopeptide (TPR) repeat protein